MAATIRVVVEASGGIGPIKKDLEGLGTSAQGAGGGFTVMKGLAVNALTAVAGAVVEAGKAVGGFVADSVSLAGDFEAGMNEFAAAAGKGFEPGTEALGEFKDLFISLGKELPVSTMEVQEAATTLIKGGLDPATVKAGALKDSLLFAAAAGMDLADAAELSIKQLATFGPLTGTAAEQTEFLAMSQNLLTKAANASTLNVDKLGDAVLAAGGAAQASGVEYKDFITTMGLISPAFGSAAEAGTSYKNFLARLIPTTDSARDMMIALGLATEDGTSKFYDATGSFIGNRAAAELLQTQLGDLTDAELAEAASTIFGNDAKGAMIALMKSGGEGYDAFAAKMEAANGVQQQAAATQQGFNFAMENFKGTVEALQITIGTALLPVFTELMNWFNQGVGVVMAFADQVIGANIPLQTIANILTGVNVPMSDMVALVTSLAQGFGLTVPQATAVVGALQAVGAAVMAIVPMFQGGTSEVTQFQAIFTTLQTYIPAVMATLQSVINAVLTQINIFWQAHGAEIMAFVQATWATLMEIYNTSLALILSIVVGVLQSVSDFINSHGQEIQTIITGVWQIIVGIITGALGVIKGLLQAALAIMKGDWEGAWEAIKGALEAAANGIVQAVTGLLNIIAALFGSSLAEIQSVWSHNWEQLKSFVTSINWSAVGSSVISGIVSGIKSAAGSLAQAAADAANSALQAAKDAIGMGSPAKAFMPVGLSMGQGMAVGLGQSVPLVAGAGAGAASAAVAGAKSVSNSRTFNYAPTINNYGGNGGGALDYSTARALGGV